MGWLVLGLRPAGARGVRSDSKEVCVRHEVGMSFARVDGGGGPTETEVRTHESANRGRSPQGVVSRRRDQRSQGRAPRARFLPAGPLRLEVTRTLGETVPQAPLGRRERQRPRSSPGGEAGGGRRVGGGRAAQALSAGASALERQRPQERRARCRSNRAGRLAQRAFGCGRSRGRV